MSQQRKKGERKLEERLLDSLGLDDRSGSNRSYQSSSSGGLLEKVLDIGADFGRYVVGTEETIDDISSSRKVGFGLGTIGYFLLGTPLLPFGIIGSAAFLVDAGFRVYNTVRGKGPVGIIGAGREHFFGSKDEDTGRNPYLS